LEGWIVGVGFEILQPEALFREASGFGSESAIVEFKQQGPKGQTYVHKIPGTMKWQNISLKRGITGNLELWKWRQQVIRRPDREARVDGSIVGYDEDGEEKIRYNFRRGWPSKWDASGLNASGNDPIIESIGDHARRAGAQAVSSRPGGLQTEFEFVLPRGFVDREGNLHRRGTMRLATANDEIAPLRDMRVRRTRPT